MADGRGKRKWDLYGADARELYVSLGINVPRIAKQLPVTAKTLYIWLKDDGWKEKRQNYQATDEHAITQLKDSYVQLALSLKNTGLAEKVTIADALSKVGKALDRFKQKKDVFRETSSVMNRFKEFLDGKEDKESLELLSRRIDEFTEDVIKSEI